jgi:protein gp37
MGEVTGISWTDHTFSPWWGCVKVSPACTNCYAELWADRFPRTAGLWGAESPRRVSSDKVWRDPLKWNKKAEADGVRRRVFCASMSDVFENRRDLDEPRARLFTLIEATPSLDWLLLTKRPECVDKLAPSLWLPGIRTGSGGAWPANVWLGTTVESQEWAEKRIPALLSSPARVHFLSAEPLLGPLDLRKWISRPRGSLIPGIDWVIVGGESGPHAREMKAEWAADVRHQCSWADIPFFYKQGWGNRPDKEPLINGVLYREVPVTLIQRSEVRE